jgi:peptidoglycan/xylan/chitin deacetylase (PgdA/CDA1 family)
MFGQLRSRSIILMYHRITSVEHDPWSLCVSPKHFAEHLDVLRKYRRMRLDGLGGRGWSIGRLPSIAITFDDGYADNFRAALPLLRRYDTPATFFIATGYIDSPGEFWWDELQRIVYTKNAPDNGSREEVHLSLYSQLQPMSHHARKEILGKLAHTSGQSPAARESHRILTSNELTALASEELVEIGSHTITHPVLSAQSAAEQFAELQLSKQRLETMLDRKVTSVSYPYGGKGHYSPATVRAVAQCGFERACTTNATCVRASDNPLEWGRIQVPDVNGEEFERFLENCGGQ